MPLIWEPLNLVDVTSTGVLSLVSVRELPVPAPHGMASADAASMIQAEDVRRDCAIRVERSL